MSDSSIMPLRLIMLLLVACVSQATSAQEIKVTGTVRDLFSENGVDSALVEVLRDDGSVMTKTMAQIPFTKESVAGNAIITRKVAKDGAWFELSVPARGTYNIRCSRPGYETAVRKIDLADMKRGKLFDAGDIYMQEKGRKLGEAVVAGTKIKMFYKGDTLVYNADAFLLPEGSMLDDLVRQLPGAEIRDGNVYVKGRLVENLLLGGKDFFNGNAQAALKNLPAYVVSRVKVYEKEGELSRTAGTDMDDKQFVMDVRLKRQYIGTYLGQLKAGYGTEDRYDGGLFAMRFDDRQSFTLTGDFNNLNTDNDYNRYGGFSRTKSDGLHERNRTAADYRFEPGGKLKLTANAVFEHRADSRTQGTAGETFLSGGNIFGRSIAHTYDRSAAVNGNTRLTLRPRNGRLYEMGYSGSYRHSDNHNSQRSASFDDLPATGATEELLDSVFLSPMDGTLRRQTLNRLRREAVGEGDQAAHKLTAHASLAFRGNLLDLSGEFGHNRQINENFDIYRLEFPKTGQADDYRRRFNDFDSRRYNYSLQGKYLWKYLDDARTKGQLTPGYTFSQRYISEQSPLYRLDRLGGEWTGDAPTVTLPSEREELLRTLDTDNSHFSTRLTLRHTAMLDWRHDRQLPRKGWLELKAGLRLHREEARLDYQRFGTSYHAGRRAWLPEPSASLCWRPADGDRNGSKIRLALQYNATASQPDLRYLLDMTDAANPLFVNMGNPGLKNMRSDRIELQFTRNLTKNRSFFSSVGYHRWHNLIAPEQTYDRESGVRTSRWVNVNGNWLTEYRFWCNMPLNKKGNLSMQTRMDMGYQHSADLSFNHGEDRTSRNTVGTFSATPALDLSCFFKNSSYINAGIRLDWKNVDGGRTDFVRIRTADVTYTLKSQLTLPGALVFSTDFRLSSRYGLSDASLNDTRLVWNASMARSIKAFTLMIRGCDLLGRNRYTSVLVNAQGRTETFSNTLPRYVILSLTWKFNKAGKKKQ